VEGRKKKNFNKNGSSLAGTGVDPQPASDRWLPAGPGPPTCGRQLLVAAGRRLYMLGCPNFFEIFLFKKK
jgi:hypothetical protein